MGLWVPASSEIDNRETWPLTNFWILLLTLLEFFHKALTNASVSHYPITAQALVSDLADPDYSLVTFSGCGAFLWITVPTFCHQLAQEGWRLLAALPVNWAVTFTHPVKEFLQRCYWSVSKIGALSVPHLPHYQPQAVLMSAFVHAVDLSMEHFRCHVNRCSRINPTPDEDLAFCVYCRCVLVASPRHYKIWRRHIWSLYQLLCQPQ